MPALTIRPSPVLRLLLPLVAFAIIVLLSSVYSTASINDDFETYTAGTSISGDTYGNNTWSVSASGTATVQSSATDSDGESAYSGTNFLRLGDTSSSTATAAYDKFLATPESPSGSLNISFALRLSSTYNTANAILYAYQMGASPSTPTALELGIVGNSGGTEARFDWYTNGTVSVGSSGAGTQNETAYGSPTVNANDWYLFNVTIGGSNAGNGYQPTYSFSVTDVNAGTVVLSESGLEATALGSGYDNISELSVQTSSTGVGNSDLDDFSITDVMPEPASLSLVTASGMVLLRRSRRRSHS